MGRAARRKRERHGIFAPSAQPAGAAAASSPETIIELRNPVADHYATFVVANALAWAARATETLRAIDPAATDSRLSALIASRFADVNARDAYLRFRRLVDERCSDRHVVEPDTGRGQHVVICGAGPSLREEAAAWVPRGDQVWACNSALPYLIREGYRVTHGVTVDQTPDMLTEWQSAPDVEYLVASTVHPHLTDYLTARGRRLRWFHNYVGIKRRPVAWPDDNGVMQQVPYETWLYWLLFPGTVMTGSGLNTTTRAIDLALCMGFDQITVLGADCAMRLKGDPIPREMVLGSAAHRRWLEENTIFHADGGHALAANATPTTLGALIDSGTPDDTVRPGCGRWWESKIDLIISARWLVAMERAHAGRLHIVGDTLVAALRQKTDAYLERLPPYGMPQAEIYHATV
jgi:hypothetical protein